MVINFLTGTVVDCSIKIHTAIGPGCFEKVYEEILSYELAKRGVSFIRQVMLPVKYEALKIPDAYKIDLFIEEKLIVEIKCVEYILPVHFKQVNTYLKLSNLKQGMLLNFKVDLMKDGIHRIFNNSGI